MKKRMTKMKKTLLSVGLAAGLLFTSIGGASAATTVHYKDVKPGDNFYKSVENLLDQKAISRTLPSFNPYDQVKRGQAASIIAKVLELDIENVKDPGFSDVPKTHQFYKYIAALANEGIVGGKGDGTFGVNQPLTRGQMSAILVDGFDIPLISIHDVNLYKYTDTTASALEPNENEMRIWFKNQFAQAIMTMDYYGYVSGYAAEGKSPTGAKVYQFKQGDPIKRSQLALMIEKIQKGLDYDYLYFKDFGITDMVMSGPTGVKIKDPSILTVKTLSNYESNAIAVGTADPGSQTDKDEYAILTLHKEGTTQMTYGDKGQSIEISVKKVNGKLKASFKKVTDEVPVEAVPGTQE